MATATEPANGILAVPAAKRTSLIATMAEKYGLEPTAFKNAIKATIFDNKGTDEELCAFLIVANHYDLNPFTKEIYAFRKQDGGIMPIVPVDGWSKIINRNPAFDGMDFVDELSQAGDVRAITCRMYRSDRSHPIQCTEYLDECVRNSMPWKQWPRRMLRHKAMIQAARYAFGLSGIHDPDEAERAGTMIVDVPSQPQGKVGVSNVNKLLDAMPSHKPQEAAQDADEYIDAVDDMQGDDYSQAEPEPKSKPAAKPAPAEAEADATTMRKLIERIKDAETPMELGHVRDDIGALSLGKMQRAELEAMLGKRQKEIGK